MRASLLLCLAAALVGAARADCDACINGQCYSKHHLPGVTREIFDIDRNTNTLYSSDGESLTQCHLDTGLCNKIPNTKEIWSLTVNQHTGATYGADMNNSMYQFDLLNSDKNVLLTVRDEVEFVTFKDKLYYSIFADKGIFTYEGGVSRIVPGSEEYEVSNFIVDKNNDIYFIAYPNRKPVRRLSKGVVEEILNDTDRYHLVVDRDGNAIVISRKIHVVYRVTNGRRTEIGAINDSLSHIRNYPPLFDRDNNIIYKVNPDKYYHLKRDSGSICTIAHSLNGVVITKTRTENDTISTIPYVKTVATSLADGNIEYNINVFQNTPAESTARTSGDEGDTSPSGGAGQQSHQPGYGQKSCCSCASPKLPNISIKIEFN